MTIQTIYLAIGTPDGDHVRKAERAGMAVWNAPRPLPGTDTWQGEFHHGIYYAATADHRLAERCRELDGWPCRSVDRDMVVSLIMTHVAEHSGEITLAELLDEHGGWGPLAAACGLPWHEDWVEADKVDGINACGRCGAEYRDSQHECPCQGGERRHGVVPTGSVALDAALGVGGYPRGQLIEIFGPEKSGKTTLTLQAVASAQQAGGTAAFIDAEHALDVNYARRLGVKVEELLVSQPDHGEQALDIAETLARSGAVDLVVVDSVSALVPRAELEGEMGDQHVGLQARLMSQAMRKLAAVASRRDCTVIFTRTVPVRAGAALSPETMTGSALKFYVGVRLEVRRIGALEDGGQVAGSRVRVEVVKNKLAPPFAEVELDLRSAS